MRKLIALLLLVTSASVLAAPVSDLTRHWLAHDESSTATIDHSAFDAFLRKYIVARSDAPNLVRYGAVTPASHEALEHYIQRLTQVPLAQYRRDVQLAYWLNLYNAILLDLVLDHYPIKSVRALTDNGTPPWQRARVTIDAIALSLDDIRRHILQPIWQEPVILYGLSWAARGGPELRARAYTAADIFVQLHNSAERFVNSPQGLTIKNDRLYASRFFDWYRDAFGLSTTALISQLREHAAPALSARLDIFDTIAGFRFDWRLNDAAPHDPALHDK